MGTVILTLLVTYSAPGAVPPQTLQAAIEREAADADIDAELVTRVLLVESRGRAQAINRVTQDYGLMQINKKTAEASGISMSCLMDWRCNLHEGVSLLASYDRPCRYNVGTGVLVGRRLQNCLTYDALLHKL